MGATVDGLGSTVCQGRLWRQFEFFRTSPRHQFAFIQPSNNLPFHNTTLFHSPRSMITSMARSAVLSAERQGYFRAPSPGATGETGTPHALTESPHPSRHRVRLWRRELRVRRLAQQAPALAARVLESVLR